MKLEKGMVVRSLAGHDKGDLMLVVGFETNYVLVCDGRQRPLCKPKVKNPKHLQATPHFLGEDAELSDKSLRKELFRLKNDT